MATPLANSRGLSTETAMQMSQAVFDDLVKIHFSNATRIRLVMANDHEIFEAAQHLRDLLDEAAQTVGRERR